MMTRTELKRSTIPSGRLKTVLLATLAGCTLLATPLRAEVSQVRVAKGFGVGYLPLLAMEHEKLFEKHAKAAGLPDSKADWIVLDGGTNQAQLLIAGNLEVSSGGLGPLITIWGKTKGNLDVKGMASINSMPLLLNTTNPAIKTIKDFTDKDRIALPVIRSSIQAVVLQMEAAKVFGADKYASMDRLTVSMAHPDGAAALLSGKTEITAHLTAPPFTYQELKNPKVHRVFSSYDVVGGPHTFNLIWTTAKFRKENPKTYAAFMAALKEAMDAINADKKKYAKLYVEATKSKLAVDFVEEIISKPEIRFTMTPEGTMAFATFMHKVGSIKEMPGQWQELFFPEVHGLKGN
ncbi:MAG: ABC transporter substrate-binding protein [Lautropia sp.]